MSRILHSHMNFVFGGRHWRRLPLPSREVYSDGSSHHAAPAAGLADRARGDGVTRAGKEERGWSATRADEARPFVVRSGGSGRDNA